MTQSYSEECGNVQRVFGIGGPPALGLWLLAGGVITAGLYLHERLWRPHAAEAPTVRRGSLHAWRMVMVLFGWGLVMLADVPFAPPVFGPFTLVASLGLAAFFFTVPHGTWPGTWLVRNSGFAWRFRWLFWYLGAMALGFAATAAYSVLTTDTLPP